MSNPQVPGRGLLIHEWLERTGGSENVFEVLTGMFPGFEKWCTWDASGGRFGSTYETPIARTPLRGRKALSVPFLPLNWHLLPKRDVDWILISSHLFAHHARFRGAASDAPSFVYTHTPARYIWTPELDPRGSPPLARAVAGGLKGVDARSAQRHRAIAANSHFVAKRVADFWGREATVIYPPVSVEHLVAPDDAERPADDPHLPFPAGGYLLGVSRFIPYKRLELVIAFGRRVGLPVVLAGSGPEEHRLREFAAQHHPGHVAFIIAPSNVTLGRLYAQALATVFPPIEDFGIVPVESMAMGTPVVVNAVGGAQESVVQGVTGASVTSWSSSDECRSAVDVLGGCNRAELVSRASEFSAENFSASIRRWLVRGLSS